MKGVIEREVIATGKSLIANPLTVSWTEDYVGIRCLSVHIHKTEKRNVRVTRSTRPAGYLDCQQCNQAIDSIAAVNGYRVIMVDADAAVLKKAAQVLDAGTVCISIGGIGSAECRGICEACCRDC